MSQLGNISMGNMFRSFSKALKKINNAVQHTQASLAPQTNFLKPTEAA